MKKMSLGNLCSQCRGVVLGNGINGMRWDKPHGFVITFFSLSERRP